MSSSTAKRRLPVPGEGDGDQRQEVRLGGQCPQTLVLARHELEQLWKVLVEEHGASSKHVFVPKARRHGIGNRQRASLHRRPLFGTSDLPCPGTQNSGVQDLEATRPATISAFMRSALDHAGREGAVGISSQPFELKAQTHGRISILSTCLQYVLLLRPFLRATCLPATQVPAVKRRQYPTVGNRRHLEEALHTLKSAEGLLRNMEGGDQQASQCVCLNEKSRTYPMPAVRVGI